MTSINNDATQIIWDGGDGNEQFYTFSSTGTANAVVTMNKLVSTDVEYTRDGTNLILTNLLTQKAMTIVNEFHNRNEGLGSIAFTQDSVTRSDDQIANLAAVRAVEELDGQHNITYDLGAGDHSQVTSVNNDATQIIWDGGDGVERFYTYGSGGPANAILTIDNLASTDVEYTRDGTNLILTNLSTQKTGLHPEKWSSLMYGFAP